jgi:lipoprotein-releasing system ATP-binding protein
VLRAIAGESGRSVVAVTHDIAMADRMDRRIHLVDGRIVSDEHAPTQAPDAVAHG